MDLAKTAIPVGAALGTAGALLVVRSILLRILHKWAAKSTTKFDDLVLLSFEKPSLLWCAAFGLMVGVDLADMAARQASYFHKAIEVLFIISVTVGASSLAGRFVNDHMSKTELPIATTGIFHGIVRGSILMLGAILVLSSLGVSITPLVTALGVGGLAVALALQDTLSNLFAGIHVLIDRPIRIGDFVRLEGGQEGFVVDITWRTTRLRTLQNAMVVIPNAKVTQNILTNWHLPEMRSSVGIVVSVDVSADPEAVEAALIAVANSAVAEGVPGLVADPAPTARLSPGFSPGAFDFTLAVNVADPADRDPVAHILRKRIWKRFRADGIPFAAPILLTPPKRVS